MSAATVSNVRPDKTRKSALSPAALVAFKLAPNPIKTETKDRGLRRLRPATHSWAPEEIAKYESFQPVGTTARLALALLMFTGVRRSDVVHLGRQHARVGWLRFKQHKNRNRYPVEIETPILPELQQIIDQSPTGDLTFLVSAYRRPFTVAGFGIRFRQWCDKAGLPACRIVRRMDCAKPAKLLRNGATNIN